MGITHKSETPYTLMYEFEYKGHNERFTYDVRFADLMDAIRQYFDNQLVILDGTDTNVYNALSELEDAIDNIFDTMEDWLKEHCKEKAYEDYKEYIDWYYDEEE